MADVDVVFHHAAMISVSESIESPEACQDVNTVGTLSVLDQARREDARVVVPSSAAVYGRPDSVPIPESAPKRPSSPYGISKLACDLYTRRYAELYGLETVTLRYFNVYGPRQRANDYSGVISIFLDRARTGRPLTVDGDGTQTRDFVHVADVVQANLLAATTDHTGEAFNIGTGSDISIRELADLVVSVTDADVEIQHSDPRDGDVPESCADIDHARATLGYDPTIELQNGLASVLDDTS